MIERIKQAILNNFRFKLLYVSLFLFYGHFSGEIPVTTPNSWIVWLFVFIIFFGPAVSVLSRCLLARLKSSHRS